MKPLSAYSGTETLILFAVMAFGLICAALLPALLSRRRQEKAMRAELEQPSYELGASTVTRLQHLEESNERLVRENGEWKARADNFLMHLEDRERKLKVAQETVAQLDEKLRVAEEAARVLKQENDQLRREGGLARSPLSVERPYGPTDDRGSRARQQSPAGNLGLHSQGSGEPRQPRGGVARGPGVPVPPDPEKDRRK